MATIEFTPRGAAPSMPPTLHVPEEQRQALVKNIRAQLDSLPTVIDSPDKYRLAKESLPLLKRAEDAVVDLFRESKDLANRTHKSICGLENQDLLPIKSARSRLSSLIYGYEQEQTRLKREEERRAAEQEQQRIQAAALEEAAAIECTDPELAEQVIEQAIAMPAPVVMLPSAKVDVAGVTSSQNWQWDYGVSDDDAKVEWDNLPQADRDRVMRLLPREYMRPDEKAITKIVKALKGSTKIPGIRVFDKGTVRTRG